MAPKPRDKGPDGLPPGVEVLDAPPASRHAFDADGRAETREGAPITIGGLTFHRRRKSWEVTRELRSLLRRQERAGGRVDRLLARIDGLTERIRGARDPEGGWLTRPLTDDDEIDRIELEVTALEDKVDEARDEADEAAYEMIALLLRDGDGARPDTLHLKNSLDSEDAGDLAATLAGGGEPDPTPAIPSSSSS